MADSQGRRVSGEVHAYDLAPAEYGRRGSNWYGVTPNGLLCTLTKHNITEHDDGAISVSPSIAVRGTVGDKPEKIIWHGYLEHGVWREV